MAERDHRNWVDAHVHLWTDDLAKYPLAAGFTRQDMKPHAFRPEDLRRHAVPGGVSRMILVQMSYYGYDNSYMLDQIRESPQSFRGIAVVDWRTGNPGLEMRNLAKHGVCGFRVYPEFASDLEQLESDPFDSMLRCAAEEDLAICFLINPEVLPLIGRLCEKHPESPVIIDHMGRIGMDGMIRAADAQAICALAKYAKIKIKLSGFYALGERKTPHLELAPLIRQLYNAFGPRRLMWGSDCPFQLVNETYADSLDLIRYQLDFLSGEDREWILGWTATDSLWR
jgi:predicted TIM-barrel fold metal-dependent hydrolase